LELRLKKDTPCGDFKLVGALNLGENKADTHPSMKRKFFTNETKSNILPKENDVASIPETDRGFFDAVSLRGAVIFHKT
jgi:hypothetical protein